MSASAYQDDQQPSGAGIAAGLVLALVVHLAVPVTLVAIAPVLERRGVHILGREQSEIPERIIEGPPMVEARFVRLGVPRDPRRLPSKNRRMQSATQTAPPPDLHGVAVSKERNPPHPTKRDQRVATDLPADALQRIGAAARRLSDETAAPVEGVSAEQGGVLGGTETDPSRAQAGSVYAGVLRRLFHGAWDMPPSSSGLTCTARIVISSDGRFASLTITRPSGNAEFDRSVENTLARFRGDAVPPIPEGEEDQYLGRARPLVFRGR